MLTGQQIRMARSALKWSARELAERTGLAMKTIQRIETTDSTPASYSSTLTDLKACFEAAGIEFIGTPDDAPGVRIHTQKD
ncbi:helix-turn-helix domain-containing protein [Yoonia sp.]|nr:helix-turn-helix transcriptional regulator [Yoonia sp.]MDB4240952.1 helix-turn-helix domain-containing protein [Yoonia sp.]